MITEPAAIHASSPIDTGATNVLSTPVLTLLPIVVRSFERVCCWFAVTFPAAMFVSCADVRIAEIREVRNLRALADAGVLELDERSRLRPGLENGAGPEVAERPDVHLLSDDRVDDDRVRPDLGAGGDAASRRE